METTAEQTATEQTATELPAAELPAWAERAVRIDGITYYGKRRESQARPDDPVDLRVRYYGEEFERELTSEEYVIRAGRPGYIPRVEGPTERGRRYIRRALLDKTRLTIHHHGGFWARSAIEESAFPLEVTYERPADPPEPPPEGAVE